jgi:hypothetical protein
MWPDVRDYHEPGEMSADDLAACYGLAGRLRQVLALSAHRYLGGDARWRAQATRRSASGRPATAWITR